MATSGQAFGTFSGRSRFRLRVAIARDSVSGNSSRWDYSLRVENLDNSRLTYALDSFPYTVVINGTTVASGSTPAGVFDFRDGADYHNIKLGTTGWIAHDSNGYKTISIKGTVSGASVFGSATASGSVVADRILPPKPNAPTGLVVARVSDTQHTLNWSRTSTYTSVVVQRLTDSGSWQTVGTAGGNAYTYTDKTTTGNHRYQYRVAGVNAGGTSGYSNTVTVYTSPSAPTGVAAARSGDDIRVSASGTPLWASSFDVQDGSTLVGTSVSLPFLHVAPDPAVTHQYTVRGKVGSLVGAWSSPSNTVQLIAPPNAPTGLAPNGRVWASDEGVIFQWTHNPVDSSPQSAFELQYRLDGGSWTTVTGATDQTVTVPLDIAAVDWQVRTKGAHPDFSPWSAVASFTVIDRPGVAVIQPADTWDKSVLDVVWTWFQAQSRPQSAWEVQLVDAGGVTVESRTGSGATSTLTLASRLTEGSWTVRARGATGDVWSLWGEESFDVAFTPPGPPVLTGVWDESLGGVGLSVAGEEFGVAVLDGAWYAEIGT